jgi:hypothetical protein
MTADAPIDRTSNGAAPSSNASHTSQVIAIPSAAPTAPITESLLLAFGDGKSFISAILGHFDYRSRGYRDVYLYRYGWW